MSHIQRLRMLQEAAYTILGITFNLLVFGQVQTAKTVNPSGLTLRELRFEPPPPDGNQTVDIGTFAYESLFRVAEVGQVLPDIGRVQQISTHDGLDYYGNLAFWAG